MVWTVISSANWAGILPPLTKLKSKETECTWMHLKVISSRHRDVIPESSVKSSSLDSSINYRYNIISHWSKQFRTIGCWSKQWTMAHWSKQFKKGTYWGKQFKTIARIGKCKFQRITYYGDKYWSTHCGAARWSKWQLTVVGRIQRILPEESQLRWISLNWLFG